MMLVAVGQRHMDMSGLTTVTGEVLQAMIDAAGENMAALSDAILLLQSANGG